VQRIPVISRLGRSWSLYSLGFLGLVTLLVVLLPTSYSLQTLSILGDALGFAANFLFFIAQGIYRVDRPADKPVHDVAWTET